MLDKKKNAQFIRSQNQLRNKFNIEEEIVHANDYEWISPNDAESIKYFWHKFDPELNGTIIVH